MARKKQWDWRAGLVGTSRRRDEPFPTLVDIEIVHIDRVLQAYGYNFVHAARALGISRATLYRKMHREVSLAAARASQARKRPRLREKPL
jgi:DNA-binding NtrC family response regulator